ncbi:unnamed protein product [Arctogadus glacialis]
MYLLFLVLQSVLLTVGSCPSQCSCSDGVKGKLELRRTLLNTLRNILQPLRALSYVALSSGADTNEPQGAPEPNPETSAPPEPRPVRAQNRPGCLQDFETEYHT